MLLQGVRILAVEQYGAGPFGTMFLADLGAEVIKIENPNDGGDMARTVGPHFFAERDSVFFHSLNRNKKSITLDLSKPQSRDVLVDLAASADGLCSNLRGDVPEKLGLTYAHFEKHNPKLVCAHLSAYGRSGPRAHWPGYDYLMQAEAGYFDLTGEPDGPPTRFGLSVVDFMTGLGLAYAMLAGLTAARARGIGSDVDVSLFDMALFNTNYLAAWYLNGGAPQTRLARSAHPSLTPCQLYATKDGYIFIMCNKEKFWQRLCVLVGHPEWAEDPEFATFAKRLPNRDRITQMLDEALSTHTTAQWMERFAGDVPASPINDIKQALDNPFVTENNRLQTLAHPQSGPYRLVDSPIRTTEPTPANPAPPLGAHTDEVLSAIGYDDSALSKLRAQQVI